jgi:hypothetical protein
VALDRNRAITAMLLADLSGEGDLDDATASGLTSKAGQQSSA